MQEEVNQKVISLSIQGVKITASVLKAALRKFLEMDNRRKQKATQVKMAEKTGRAQEKGREKARKKIEMCIRDRLGSYYVKELKAPDGFVSSDEVLRFDASYQGQDVQTVSYTHLLLKVMCSTACLMIQNRPIRNDIYRKQY